MKHYLSLKEVKADLQSGAINCVGLVEGYLQNIEERKGLNAFLEVFGESALEQAKAVDAKLAAGTAGSLAGMVIGLKDNIAYEGHKVSASSNIINGFESLYSATAVKRLLSEDAIIIGRLNCDEFAMGSSNEHSAYGPVKNPLDENRVPGGSSGGSAAAVAGNLCLATLGSDTGGSIRQPASFCGVVGFKPTYGRISRYGLLAYGSSLDQIGPFTQSVEDAALLYQIMAGADEYDTTASTRVVDEFTPANETNKTYTFAYFKEVAASTGLNPEVKSAFEEKIKTLEKAGHTVKAVDFPLLDKMVPTYYVISNAEASSNLSRYTGVNYGVRSEKAHDVDSTFTLSRSEGFGAEVKRRIMLGTFVLSAGYYDAYYTQAQKVRQLIKKRTEDIFSEADFIISPTTPHTAFEFGAKSDDPVAMYLEDIFTVHANLSGNPAISLPLGKHSNKMPFGMQITAAHFNEQELFRVSTDWMSNQ